MKYFILVKNLSSKKGFDHNVESSLTAKDIKILCESRESTSPDTETVLMVDGNPAKDSDVINPDSKIECIIRIKKAEEKSPLKN